MIVVHGVNRYGKVDAVGDEYLVTRFHHLFGFPLFPTGSEWITGRDCTGFYGRACRLSLRSVVAAYLRTWGALLAAALAAMAVHGPVAFLVPSIILALLAAATVTMSQTTDPRELRRIALQRPVLGLSIDPLRLPRDTATILLANAQERFEAMSAGRTALDVARRGATSQLEAGYAFVVLRLIAASHVGHVQEDALFASEQLLDGTETVPVAESPYRAASVPVLVPSRPLLESYPLRPHRWHFVIASLISWLACAASIPPMHVHHHGGERKSDIASTGVKKLAYESYPQWVLANPNVGRCPSIVELTEYGGSTNDPWGNPYMLRCDRLPDGAVGIAVWSAGEDKRDDWGAGDDHASWDQR